MDRVALAPDPPSPLRRSLGLVLAVLAAAVFLAVAFVVRVAVDLPGSSALPQRLMPVLVAAAALCAAALTVRRLPSIAWLSTAITATIASEEIVVVARAAQALVAPASWRMLVALSVAALIAGAVVAAAYAGRRRGVAEPKADVRVVAGILVGGLAVSLGAGAWALATAWTDPNLAAAVTAEGADSWPLRLTARASLGLIAIGIVVGVARDLIGPVGRTRERRRAAASGPGEGPPATFLRDLADELLPIRTAERRRASAEERARLAADLHAFVLPELRQAAAAASSAGLPDDVAARVRRSLEQVESLMHERQSIVLEQFGLVAALEWLAERTEERSSVRVHLELEGDAVDDPATVPPDVARLAFRVALLALDNVVRHAAASLATIHLQAARERVRLSITDDGHAADAAGGNRSGRGIVDMRTEAGALGAAVSVAGTGTGTRVDLDWPASAAAAFGQPSAGSGASAG